MDANIQPNDWFTHIEKRKYSIAEQIGILLALILGGFIVAAIIQLIISFSMLNLSNLKSLDKEELLRMLALPQNFTKVLFMQLFSTMAIMALPAFAFAKIIKEKPLAYLGFLQKISLQQIVIVIVIALVGILMNGGLAELNKMIPLSKGLKQTFDQWEKDYEQQVMIFANMKTMGDYILALIVVAIFPAIFEELLFRSTIQRVLINMFKQPHVAIIVTAILFSIVHFSFYGLLPRLMLGVVLGYIYFYGKSIWLNALMHFINNGLAITALYFGGVKQDETFPVWVGLVAVAALIVLLQYFRKISKVTYKN